MLRVVHALLQSCYIQSSCFVLSKLKMVCQSARAWHFGYFVHWRLDWMFSTTMGGNWLVTGQNIEIKVECGENNRVQVC